MGKEGRRVVYSMNNTYYLELIMWLRKLRILHHMCISFSTDKLYRYIEIESIYDINTI